MSAISTRNVTRVFRDATPAQLSEGMSWYATALEFSRALGVAYDLTTEQTAGIVAALSPRVSWGQNVNSTIVFLKSGGVECGELGANVAKSRRIYAGESNDSVLGGNKVRAFYACIMAAGITNEVCIDRHAYDVMTNARNVDATRPKMSDTVYRLGVAAYQNAARILSKEYGYTITPAQVQAVTWTAWRARYWAEGAHDVKL